MDEWPIVSSDPIGDQIRAGLDEVGRAPAGVRPTKRLSALSHIEARTRRNHPPGPLRRLWRAAKAVRKGR